MDTLISIQVFHQVVATNSFTKAADKLDMSVAMTSKHIAHLERLLGTKLMQRNSRNIHLTEAGERYHAQSLYALEILDCAKQQAQGATDIAQGVLKITMPRWFANPKVASYLAQFNKQYPNVILDLSLSNQMVDLVAEGFDLALRLSNEPKPSLITRPLGRVDFYLLTSPDYIKKHGMITTPDELSNHQIILPTYVKMDNFDITHKATNTQYNLQLNAHAFSDDTLMNHQMILANMGIGFAPSWIAEEDIRAGRLVRLLKEYEIWSVGLYAAYVDRAFLSAKVRAFIDFWVEKCHD